MVTKIFCHIWYKKYCGFFCYKKANECIFISFLTPNSTPIKTRKIMLHFSQICSSTATGSLLIATLTLSITLLLLQCCCRGQCQKKKNKRGVVTKAPNTRLSSKPKTSPSHPSSNQNQGGAKKGGTRSSEDDFEQQDNVPLAAPVDSLTCGVHMRRSQAPAVKTAVNKSDDQQNLSAEPLPKTFTLGKKAKDIKEQNLKKDIANDPYPTISIKDKVYGSKWRTGGATANNTYGEIVLESFEEVKKLGRHASACRLYDMYHPEIGSLRKSKSYSSLAPTNAVEYNDRKVDPGLRPFYPYKPKQNEWKNHMEKVHHMAPAKGIKSSAAALPPLPPTYRRQMPVSADLTRFENFAIYWNGRAKGLDYSQPFLFEPQRDDYDIMEDRRYQRIYWAPKFIPHFPTPRHSRQMMLTAY